MKMNIFYRAITGSGRWLAQLALVPLRAITHPRVGMGWSLLNRTSINYEREARPEASSIVVACIGWIQRTFSEAPLNLEEWKEERKEWEAHARDELLDLLERPNPYYNGTTLWKATIADRILNGTGYWIKVRSQTGRVVQLWWAPESTMEPKTDERDPTVFISHYEYRPGQGNSIPLRVEDVVRFPEALDPSNPRKGLSKMKSLFREVFTDDEAANMTASLLRNMGVPGVIIAPKGTARLSAEAAKQVKEAFLAKFSGDKKGEPMIMEGETTIEQFGFSPEQMQLRSLRGIPEERITAVLGVNAAVVGLGAGLATTKVGATLREYREEAFESTIIPMYRELSSELTHQLLSDFKRVPAWRFAYDLTRIRVLQDDEIKRSELVRGQVKDGLITLAEARRRLGYIALPEHEIYLRPTNVFPVPVGQGIVAPRASSDLLLRRDAERLEAALAMRLEEPGIKLADLLPAHYLLTAETTCSTLGISMPESMSHDALAQGKARVPSFDGARPETRRAQDWAVSAAQEALAR